MLKESTKRILGGSTWNEETQNELARTREELHNAKEEVKRLTPNSEPRCGIKKHNHFKLCSKRSSNC